MEWPGRKHNLIMKFNTQEKFYLNVFDIIGLFEILIMSSLCIMYYYRL